MKKVFVFMVLAVVCSHAAMSQTELYKQMCHVKGITASCIENCPISDSVRVSVTMLEVDDTATYNRLMADLKELVITREPTLRTKFLKRLSHLFTLQMTIEATPAQVIGSKRPLGKTMTTRLILGRSTLDSNELLVVYSVAEQQTALVFHCKDEAELEQVLVYVCGQIRAACISLGDE
ncbi:MAG: hypothetical protein MJZ86_09200 [Bacteroidales bacterium]|nr:hypothetical protein [Bacteroidales bacterium]